MKAVPFYSWNLEPTSCLYRFGLAFLPLIVDATFGIAISEHIYI